MERKKVIVTIKKSFWHSRFPWNVKYKNKKFIEKNGKSKRGGGHVAKI